MMSDTQEVLWEGEVAWYDGRHPARVISTAGEDCSVECRNGESAPWHAATGGREFAGQVAGHLASELRAARKENAALRADNNRLREVIAKAYGGKKAGGTE